MNAPNPPPRKSPWPLIVIALLVGHITLMTVAVAIATHDHNGSAVIPDYYQKAANWDRTRAKQRAAAEGPTTAPAHAQDTQPRGDR